MHGASTKQRLSAIRRRLGIFTGAPRWARERRRHQEAAAARRTAETADDVRPRPVPPARSATPVAWVSDSMVLQATAASGRAAVEPLDEAVDQATTEVDGRAPSSGPVRRRGPALLAAFALVAGLLAAFAVLRGPPSTAGAAPTAPQALAAPPVAVEPPAAPPPLAVATATATAPIAEAAGPAELEVRPGDTLWDLAARHLGDPFAWPKLHDANRDQIRDPDLIHPGQRLKLPAS